MEKGNLCSNLNPFYSLPCRRKVATNSVCGFVVRSQSIGETGLLFYCFNEGVHLQRKFLGLIVG